MSVPSTAALVDRNEKYEVILIAVSDIAVREHLYQPFPVGVIVALAPVKVLVASAVVDIVPVAILKVTSASGYEDTLIWKNKHMDFFQAQELTDDLVAMKYQHDFRPSNYTLAQRLGPPRDTAQRLSLNNLQFKQCAQDLFRRTLQ